VIAEKYSQAFKVAIKYPKLFLLIIWCLSSSFSQTQLDIGEGYSIDFFTVNNQNSKYAKIKKSNSKYAITSKRIHDWL